MGKKFDELYDEIQSYAEQCVGPTIAHSICFLRQN
jgi:hypothetical protein